MRSKLISKMLRKTKVLRRPVSTRQHECVQCRCGANEFSAGILLRAHLKAQRRVLVGLEACCTQVGRVPHSLFIRLCRIDNTMTACNKSSFIVDVLLARSFNAFQAIGKFRLFFLEPRKLFVEQCLFALECKHCPLCVDEMGEKLGSGNSDLGGIPPRDKAFGDGFRARESGNGDLNFTEHGCPFDSRLQVEEPAFSVETGIQPAKEVANG